jgi:hypothetical protein
MPLLNDRAALDLDALQVRLQTGENVGGHARQHLIPDE